MSNDSYTHIGFGDSSVPSDTFLVYKPSPGRTDRMAILSGPKGIIWSFVHYHDDLKFVICSSGGKGGTVCCENLPDSQQRFGIVIFHYDTDREGEIINPTKCIGTVKLWVLTEGRYSSISQIHKDFNLVNESIMDGQRDLLVKCPEKNQRILEFKPAEPAHYKTQVPWYEQISTLTAPRAAGPLKNRIGQVWSDQEIFKALGMSGANSSNQPGLGQIDLETPDLPNINSPDADDFNVDLGLDLDPSSLDDDDIPF